PIAARNAALKLLLPLLAVSMLAMLAGSPADAGVDARHRSCPMPMACRHAPQRNSNEELTPRMAEVRDACVVLRQKFDGAIAGSNGSAQAAARARRLGAEGADLCSSNAIEGVAKLEEALSLI